MTIKKQKFWNSLNKFPEEVTPTSVFNHITKKMKGSYINISNMNPESLSILALKSIAKNYDCCYVSNYINCNDNKINEYTFDKTKGDLIFDLKFENCSYIRDFQGNDFNEIYTLENPLFLLNGNKLNIYSDCKRVIFKSVFLSKNKYKEILDSYNS